MNKLNLGCAGRKKEGYINVDWQSIVEPDVAHDLNKFPYPFKESSFDLIEADHVLEHLDRPFFVMTELHRILKPGGELKIKVPHFTRSMTHSEHFHGFDVMFPNYFNPKFRDYGFFGVEFDVKKVELHWLAFFHIMESVGYGKFSISALKFINKVISFLANLNKDLCSRIWCFWVGGFDEIEFNFICKKQKAN